MRGKRTLIQVAVVSLALIPIPGSANAQESPTGPSAFLVETAGATVGSAAGFGLALALSKPGECGDDLACTLEKIGLSLIVSAGGAAVGDIVAGNMADTRPSAPGAIAGSLAGIAAGIGVVHLFSEELDLTQSDAALFVTYSLTQGIVTALGSRIGAWLRD